ncbi:MAG TPA: DinB family protein [Thiolinea sp.]|nr:DinB family protein [Thiolinea sp.]
MNSITLETLSAFPQQLEKHFYTIPQSRWQWQPESWDGIPSESLNPLEQICHVRDIEVDGYHVRFRRMLEEIEPILESVDGYALVKERHYAQADPHLVFEGIKAARTTTLQLIAGLTDQQLARTGYFDGYGRLNVQSLIHYLCSHDQQHLAGLQWLLGKISSANLAAMR